MESKKKALYKYALTAYLCGSMISGLYATELANEQLNFVQQQEIIITGQVIDKSEPSIQGVTVVDKKHPLTNGTITEF